MKQNTRKIIMAIGIAIAVIIIMIIGYFAGSAIKRGSGSDTVKQEAKVYEKYIELGKYKGIEVDKRTVSIDNVTEEAIEEDIYYLLEEHTEYTEVTDRGIKTGDYVVFDFEGEVNGEKPEDMTAENYEITVGEGEFLEEFEENIIGLKTGDGHKFEMTFPEDYEGYGGQKVTFTVKITSIQEIKEAPELTEEFVKENTEYDSVEALREGIKVNLYEQEAQDADDQIYSDIMSIIVENSVLVDYTQEMFDETYAEMEYEMEEAASMFGMSLEEYMEMFYGEATIPEEWITERILQNGVTAMIMAKENISLKDSEYNKLVEENLEMLDVETVEEAEEYYGKEELMDYFLPLKLQEFLIKEAKITELSAEEYDKKYESSDLEEEEESEE